MFFLFLNFYKVLFSVLRNSIEKISLMPDTQKARLHYFFFVNFQKFENNSLKLLI